MHTGTERHDPAGSNFEESQPTGAERRRDRRRPVPTDITCFLSSSRHVLVPARVLDLSTGGVGLLTGADLEPGSLVSVTMCRGHFPEAVHRIILVAHCTDQPGCFCLAGGRFLTGLGPAELAALLGE